MRGLRDAHRVSFQRQTDDEQRRENYACMVRRLSKRAKDRGVTFEAIPFRTQSHLNKKDRKKKTLRRTKQVSRARKARSGIQLREEAIATLKDHGLDPTSDPLKEFQRAARQLHTKGVEFSTQMHAYLKSKKIHLRGARHKKRKKLQLALTRKDGSIPIVRAGGAAEASHRSSRTEEIARMNERRREQLRREADDARNRVNDLFSGIPTQHQVQLPDDFDFLCAPYHVAQRLQLNIPLFNDHPQLVLLFLTTVESLFVWYGGVTWFCLVVFAEFMSRPFTMNSAACYLAHALIRFWSPDALQYIFLHYLFNGSILEHKAFDWEVMHHVLVEESMREVDYMYETVTGSMLVGSIEVYSYANSLPAAEGKAECLLAHYFKHIFIAGLPFPVRVFIHALHNHAQVLPMSLLETALNNMTAFLRNLEEFSGWLVSKLENVNVIGKPGSMWEQVFSGGVIDVDGTARLSYYVVGGSNDVIEFHTLGFVDCLRILWCGGVIAHLRCERLKITSDEDLRNEVARRLSKEADQRVLLPCVITRTEFKPYFLGLFNRRVLKYGDHVNVGYLRSRSTDSCTRFYSHDNKMNYHLGIYRSSAANASTLTQEPITTAAFESFFDAIHSRREDLNEVSPISTSYVLTQLMISALRSAIYLAKSSFSLEVLKASSQPYTHQENTGKWRQSTGADCVLNKSGSQTQTSARNITQSASDSEENSIFSVAGGPASASDRGLSNIVNSSSENSSPNSKSNPCNLPSGSKETESHARKTKNSSASSTSSSSSKGKISQEKASSNESPTQNQNTHGSSTLTQKNLKLSLGHCLSQLMNAHSPSLTLSSTAVSQIVLTFFTIVLGIVVVGKLTSLLWRCITAIFMPILDLIGLTIPSALFELIQLSALLCGCLFLTVTSLIVTQCASGLVNA